jgi:hypothetical protein
MRDPGGALRQNYRDTVSHFRHTGIMGKPLAEVRSRLPSLQDLEPHGVRTRAGGSRAPHGSEVTTWRDEGSRLATLHGRRQAAPAKAACG